MPVSLVFVTEKTEGVVGLFTRVGGSCATVASGLLPLRARLAEVERVVLNALAKLEATKIEPIDNKATAIKRKLAINSSFLFVLLRHANSHACRRKPTRLKKTCGPKKADGQAGFFLMRRLLTRPGARSP